MLQALRTGVYHSFHQEKRRNTGCHWCSGHTKTPAFEAEPCPPPVPRTWGAGWGGGRGKGENVSGALQGSGVRTTGDHGQKPGVKGAKPNKTVPRLLGLLPNTFKTKVRKQHKLLEKNSSLAEHPSHRE